MTIPKGSIRNYAVLNICVQETKVFSTKERAPCYICLEIFRPEEDYPLEKLRLSAIDKNSSKKGSKKRMNSQNPFKIIDLSYSNPITIKKGIMKKKNEKSQEKLSFFIASGVKGSAQEPEVRKDLTKSLALPKNPLTWNEGSDNEFQDYEQIKYFLKDIKKNSGEIENFIDLEKDSEDIDMPSEANHLNPILKQADSNNSQKENEIDQAHNQFTSDFSNRTHGISCVYGGATNKKKSKVKYQVNILAKQHSNSVDLVDSINNRYSSQKAEFRIEDRLLNEEEKEALNLIKENIKEASEEKIEENNEFSDRLFGEDSKMQFNRIRKSSPFRELKSWNLVHLIVKTGDNLKQEQFALQLIYQFEQIFKEEKLDLILRTYEVLSLGPEAGIIEMVKDACTLDRLKQSIYKDYKSLNQFFVRYYGTDLKKALDNFCKSLAAYSLICYFLQIKDRHNGNILLHKEGYILHIDFGFLLSNMPGKGIDLEKAVPFKFLTEYIEILGGQNSGYFSKFRRLFYKGFKAARKHQDKITLLVKMMYSSHGQSLPCFKTGEKGLEELVQRFNPPGINDDGDLNIFTQNLINQAVDNFRTRWYDKFQYYFQGIFY